MPNIKSAKKRVLINAKKNNENRALRSQMNTAIKKFNNAVETNNIAEAEALLPQTMSVIDRTVSKGVIHKNNAANKKSALSKKLSDVKSGKIEIQIKKDNKTIAAEKARAAQAARDAVRAENAKKAAERQAAKLEAEKAKLEAEGKGKKTKASAKTEKAEKPAKKAAAKAETEAEEKPVKKPAAKAAKSEEAATEEKPAKKPAAKKKTEPKAE